MNSIELSNHSMNIYYNSFSSDFQLLLSLIFSSHYTIQEN